MRLTGERLPLGRAGRPVNPWRVLAYLAVIGVGVLLLRGLAAGQVRPLLLATPTATRPAESYAEEGRTFFSAGRLDDAIQAYQQAVDKDPTQPGPAAELARILTYSSALLTTAAEKNDRLSQARQVIDAATEANPDHALAHAVRTLVYDWSAAAAGGAERDRLLKEAEESAVRALQLDPGSPLALAYYAELLLDEGKFAQAYDLAEQAAAQTDPQDPLSMDVHRVFGTVLEGNGAYRQAIEEYQAAAEIAPNFTYLYLLIGTNYRTLGGKAPTTADRRVLMGQALDAFDRAARINQQLRIDDPTPYLAIGKTYLQDGEFFVAAINVERALAIDPSNPDIFGRLGIIFFKARNYESAVEVLACAIDGCNADKNGALLCELKIIACDEATTPVAIGQEVPGLPLSDATLEYYYTYASVLTSFRGSDLVPNACGRAAVLLDQLTASYGSDPIVAGIVAENRGLCSGTVPTTTPLAQPTGGSPSG
ncbi:MAG TPA: tetratricopeptide repeat protein [Anaerolineales bacterium]|nr:tetratricopeptide repeat protein [Anaerolineales bacterium]